MYIFDIHTSVYRNYNCKLQPTRCDVSWFVYFYRRSTSFRQFLCSSSGAHNCMYSFRYCQPILLLVAIVDEMELSSISSTVAASSSIGWQYLKQYVQLCAPDYGRRNRPKHAQCLQNKQIKKHRILLVVIWNYFVHPTLCKHK